MEVTPISRGVEISIAGGVAETEDCCCRRYFLFFSFFFFFFFLFFLLFFLLFFFFFLFFKSYVHCFYGTRNDMHL